MLQILVPQKYKSVTHLVPSSEGSGRIYHILYSDDDKTVSSVILPIIPSVVT